MPLSLAQIILVPRHLILVYWLTTFTIEMRGEEITTEVLRLLGSVVSSVGLSLKHLFVGAHLALMHLLHPLILITSMLDDCY